MQKNRYIAVLFLLMLNALPVSAQVKPALEIRLLTPAPEGFYSKYLDANGISIRASAAIDDLALFEAQSKIDRLLTFMPVVRQNLIHQGAEMHIIGKNQLTSDLPEFRAHKGEKYMDRGKLTDIDQRARGTGGLQASCGEENLLCLPTDGYQGLYDVCTHEFAHTIMDFGLDDQLREKIAGRMKSALLAGKWTGAYAATNAGEYWAELTLWYFGKHGAYIPGTQLPADGPEGLSAYDSEGYTLADSIYSGRLQPKAVLVKPAKKVTATLRSGMGTQPSSLTIINHTGNSLQAYWVSFNGKKYPAGAVPAYGRTSLSTMDTHVWMIQTANGKLVGYYQTGAGSCEIRI